MKVILLMALCVSLSQISILPDCISRCSWGVLRAFSLGFTCAWAWREAVVQADGMAWISTFCPRCRVSVGRLHARLPWSGPRMGGRRSHTDLHSNLVLRENPCPRTYKVPPPRCVKSVSTFLVFVLYKSELCKERNVRATPAPYV